MNARVSSSAPRTANVKKSQMEENTTLLDEVETDARPGTSDSQKKPVSQSNPKTINHEHASGARTTIELSTSPGRKLPNIQVGDNNTMIIGGSWDEPVSSKKKKDKKKVVKKIEAPKRDLTDSDYDVVASRLGRDYRRLYRHLGLSDIQMEQISMDYKDEGAYEVNYQMLRKWKQLGQSKLQILVNALQEIEREDIVKLLIPKAK